MKIAIDISAGIRAIGGIGTYTRELVSHLMSIDSLHQYSLLINSMKITNLFHDDFHYLKKHRVLLPRSWLTCLWSKTEILPVEMFTGSIDIFHAPHVLLPPLKKAKGVLTVHDCTFLKYPNLFKYHNFSRWEYTKLLPVSLKRATRIAVDSKATLYDLLNYFSIDEKKIDLVPLGVSNIFFEYPVNANSYAANKTKPFILSVIGTPEPRKNIPALLKAHYIFVKKGYDIPLWIVTKRRDVEQFAQDIVPDTFLKQYVKFMEKLPQEKLIAFLHDCFIFAYPSLYEGFGLPVLEAMAAGACVVAGNRGSIPEIVENTGILVEPESPSAIANAFIALAENNQMRSNLGNQAQERAKEFTWEKTAKQMLKVYEKAWEA